MRVVAALVLAVLAMSSMLPALQGSRVSIGYTGTFGRFPIYVKPGQTLSSPDIYMVVVNPNSFPVRVEVEVDAPVDGGVDVYCEPSSFTLEPGESRRVSVTISADRNAVPGSYMVHAAALVYVETGGSVAVSPGAGTYAEILVVGEAGTLRVRLRDRGGNPVSATVRVLRHSQGYMYEFEAGTGSDLEFTVPPGVYTVQVMVGQNVVKEVRRYVGANETVDLVLVIETVYFRSFNAFPGFRLGFLRDIYAMFTVENLYEPLPDTVIRLVLLDDKGGVLDSVVVAELSTLPTGVYSSEYLWRVSAPPGRYCVRAEVVSRNVIYAVSSENCFVVNPLGVGLVLSGFILPWWLLLLLLLLLLILLLYIVGRRRRERRQGSKGRRAKEAARNR